MRHVERGRYSTDGLTTHAVIQGRSTIVDSNSSNLESYPVDPATTPYIYLHKYNVGADWYKTLVRFDMEVFRSLIGMAPVILRAQLHLWSVGTGSGFTATVNLHRILDPAAIDLTDASYRYRDRSGLVTWYGDAYSPVSGRDIAEDPFASQAVTTPATTPSGYDVHFDITDEVAYCLRANRDLWAVMLSTTTTGAGQTTRFHGPTHDGKRPYITIDYVLPIEFALSQDDGSIDLSKLADNEGLDLERAIYLGAWQRGETGSAERVYLRNFATRDFPHVSVWDDSPTWEPVAPASGNTGTGALDYVELYDDAVSQMYTVKFDNATDFKVKALAFRDNTSNLNPTYGTAGWDGDITSDFIAPSGGLVIPKEAWQPGHLVNDEFVVYVLGNSTNSAWPADADEQYELAEDDGSGDPDAATWRVARGRRTRSRASVTVDATTKKFPTYAVVPSQWTVGGDAFVADNTKIQRGTVSQVDEATIGADTFTGTGLDDLTASGNYNGVRTLASGSGYRVEIDATGTPDTFKWSRDGGSTWVATGVAITGAAQLLEDGIYVTFAATTGHTATDRWDFAVTAWGVTLANLTNNSDVFAVGSRVESTLPIRSLSASVWTRSTAAAGASQSPANRVYLSSVTGLAIGNTIYIEDLENSAVNEEATISYVASSYVDLAANLDGDYASGAFVAKKGSGEAFFHARVVAGAGTTEELKEFFLNARI